jgi:hypothetical protein
MIKAIRNAVPRNNFLKMFIHIYLLLLQVSALVGHHQVEYTTISGRYLIYNGSVDNVDNTRDGMQN